MKLPKDFESYFRERWDAEAVDALISGLQGEPSVSIRLNTARLPIDAEPEGADGRVPWCPEGIYLKSRPAFTADPLLHAGAYYVQEASSMFLALVLRSLVPRTSSLTAVLDLCAAPGGKSTLMRNLLPDDCLLVSNEPVRARVQVLAENMAKWGHPNVKVTQAYAADIAETVGRGGRKKGNGSEPFDLILADVPCSGEGMMRKEEEAVRQWSPEFVTKCAALQRSIVADIWPALRPGGFLIYSTCTFNPEEDEDNVEWIARKLGADIETIPVESAWNICGDLRTQSTSSFDTRHSSFVIPPPSGGYRGSSPSGGHRGLPFCHFLPSKVRGEGFFCAVLRKHDDETGAKAGGSSKKTTPLATLPTDLLDDADAPRVDLTLPDAIRYLQREALVLPVGTPLGIIQVCYQGQRLGLAKNLGTRANNLYPKEWRIRTSHLIPHTLFSLSD